MSALQSTTANGGEFDHRAAKVVEFELIGMEDEVGRHGVPLRGEGPRRRSVCGRPASGGEEVSTG
jgi:hypothetical protein